MKTESNFIRRLRVILRDNDITLDVMDDGRLMVSSNNPFGSSKPQVFRSAMACADHFIPLLNDNRLSRLLAENVIGMDIEKYREYLKETYGAYPTCKTTDPTNGFDYFWLPDGRGIQTYTGFVSNDSADYYVYEDMTPLEDRHA